MRRGTCVKCGSATVRAAANGVQLGDHPQAVLRPNVQPGFKGILRTHRTDVWTFLCTTCGYTELYVLDPAALAFATEQWGQVEVAT